MSRYAKRPPRSYEDWEEDRPHVPAITVEMHDGTPTGVLDTDGNEFLKLPDKIGFVRFE